MKNSRNLLIAFVVGQLIQLAMYIIANILYIQKPVIWAAAAGMLLTIAIMAGMAVAIIEFVPADKRTAKGTHEKVGAK